MNAWEAIAWFCLGFVSALAVLAVTRWGSTARKPPPAATGPHNTFLAPSSARVISQDSRIVILDDSIPEVAPPDPGLDDPDYAWNMYGPWSEEPDGLYDPDPGPPVHEERKL